MIDAALTTKLPIYRDEIFRFWAGPKKIPGNFRLNLIAMAKKKENSSFFLEKNPRIFGLSSE